LANSRGEKETTEIKEKEGREGGRE